MNTLPAITVEALHQWRLDQKPHFLLDVREDHEVAAAAISGATYIKMHEVPQHLTELPKDMPLVVMCRSGGRSARVTEALQRHGFSQALNLTGGIMAWAQAVDPTLKPV